MHTEEQAAALFCPSVDKGLVGSPPFKGEPICVASKCAAWRWGPKEYTDGEEGATLNPRRGYCGLAGKPLAD